jgi:hypothetical protein
VWARHVIKADGAPKHHDLAFGDVDGDGADELVYWNQGAANALFVAEIPTEPSRGPWPATEIFANGPVDSEGLDLADVDGDGVVDIVGAGLWFRRNVDGSFTANPIDAAYARGRTAVGQLVPGGRPEVVIDSGDTIAPLNWYEWNENSGTWAKHELLAESRYGHSLRIADIDGDGHLDVLSAEMRSPDGRRDDPDARLTVLYGDGAGSFEAQTVEIGIDSHESRLADLDGDGDIDIFGKRFNVGAPGIDIWLAD